MNAKTLEAITRHGETLLRAFPNATEKNPVTLCKKLRRIETATHRIMTDYCNGDCDEYGADKASDSAYTRLQTLLGDKKTPMIVNRDPRGYALKLDDAWTRKYNNALPCNCCRIHTDMGGYGILAPDLTVE